VRVDHHAEPLVELRRLVRIKRALNVSSRGEELLAEKKFTEAQAQFREAVRLAPEYVELEFWYGVALANAGLEAEAIPVFRELFSRQPFWADVLLRLPSVGAFPDDPALMKRIQALRSVQK
jgi:tetratricopeptide (TPR) repeat protein